jgi:hypothetical protein
MSSNSLSEKRSDQYGQDCTHRPDMAAQAPSVPCGALRDTNFDLQGTVLDRGEAQYGLGTRVLSVSDSMKMVSWTADVSDCWCGKRLKVKVRHF